MNKRRTRTRPTWAWGPALLWACCLVSWMGLVSPSAAWAESQSASTPVPPLYVANFNRSCHPDPSIASAAVGVLMRLGDAPEILPGWWGGNECCGLADCAQKLQTRYGSVVGGQLERTAAGPQAQIWILQPHKGRVLLAQHTCADCDQPRRIARMIAGLAEQIPSPHAAWVPVSSLPLCTPQGDGSRRGSAAPAGSPDNQTGAPAGQPGTLLSVLLSIRGSGANLPSARALRGGLMKQLLQSGYAPSLLAVPTRIEDPRELLRGDRARIPVVDVDVRREGKGSEGAQKQAIESVTLRLFHPTLALQTSLDCSLHDCSGRPLVAMSRTAAGNLMDQLASLGSVDSPRTLLDTTPACLPVAAPAQETARPEPSPPSPAPQRQSAAAPSPPQTTRAPADGAVEAAGPPPPNADAKKTLPWSIRLGIAGVAIGIASAGVGALIGVFAHGSPSDRTCYCNLDAWTPGHWMIGIGAGVAVAGTLTWLSGVRRQASPDPASPASQPSEVTP